MSNRKAGDVRGRGRHPMTPHVTDETPHVIDLSDEEVAALEAMSVITAEDLAVLQALVDDTSAIDDLARMVEA